MTGSCTPSAPVRRAVRPGSYVWALDATNGNLLWEYKRPTGGANNTKAFAMFEDMIYYPAGDTIVALDARTGAVRWETVAAVQGGRLSSGLMMAGDKIISGRTCWGSATGRQAVTLRRTMPEPERNSGSSTPRPVRRSKRPTSRGEAHRWRGVPLRPGDLTGSYDPVKKVIYWGVANPTPNTRAARHGGNSNAIGMSAPADLYSNSTVALNPENGKLLWYYQHLPGDDWDQDYTNERILLRTAFNPDPKAVKWINPSIPKELAARYFGFRR